MKGSGVRGAGRLPSIGTNDGKGVMFVSHTGEIYPSGFLPIRCGRGGSRSRSYALTSDPLAAEPDCAYLPPRWEAHASPNSDALPAEPFLSHFAGAGSRQ